jgi:hypothetical protein
VLYWKELLQWLLVNVIVSKRVTILQTATVCLNMYIQFLIPATFIYLSNFDCGISKGQSVINKYLQQYSVTVGVSKISQMLRKEKCYFQVKYVCQNVVSQMCSRSIMLDIRCVSICLMFMRTDFYGYNLQDTLQRDMWLWPFKKYLHRLVSVCPECKLIMKSLGSYRN